MSLDKLANKVYEEVMAEHDGEIVDGRELFVHAFVIGFMYNEGIGDGDVKLVYIEDQLDLPIH